MQVLDAELDKGLKRIWTNHEYNGAIIFAGRVILVSKPPGKPANIRELVLYLKLL